MTGVSLRPSESCAVRWHAGKWSAVAVCGPVRVAIRGCKGASAGEAITQALTALRITVQLAGALNAA